MSEGYFDPLYGWVSAGPTPASLKPPSFRPGESEVARVEPGDTLGAIAAANNVSLDELLAANPQIDNPDMISIGEAILIPGDRVPTISDDLTGEPVNITTTPGFEVDDSGTVGDDVGAQAVSVITTPGYETDAAEEVATIPDPATGLPVDTTTGYVSSSGDQAGTSPDEATGLPVSTTIGPPLVIGGPNGVTIVNDPTGGPPIVIPNSSLSRQRRGKRRERGSTAVRGRGRLRRKSLVHHHHQSSDR